MSHLPDLEADDDSWVPVGWLEPGFPYSQGAVPPEFVARLKEFARRWSDSIEALQAGVAMGIHTCGFCGKAHAAGTFGVPAGKRLYRCPELIAHYVEQHGYAPPADFITAVLNSPLPGTPEYTEAVQRFIAKPA